jgi:hypothetical protein
MQKILNLKEGLLEIKLILEKKLEKNKKPFIILIA